MGVGKPSLINRIFKVDLVLRSQLLNYSLMLTLPQNVYEYTAGEADINKEIYPANNDCWVLHYSLAYGSGEVENFRKLTEFIDHRTGNANVRDRLHAIWYIPPSLLYT